MDTDRSIRAAGGFIVQLMPGAPDELITKLEDNIFLMDQLTTILDEDGIDAVAAQVLKDMQPEIVDRHGVEYRCYCTRERVSEALRGVASRPRAAGAGSRPSPWAGASARKASSRTTSRGSPT